MMMRKTLFILVFCFGCLGSWGSVLRAQSGGDIELDFETVAEMGRGSNAPFWLTSNRQGLSSISNNNGYVRLSTFSDFDKRDWRLNYGVDVAIAHGFETGLYIQQFYLDVSWRWLGASVGMKEHWSDKNARLSSGALTWSGNARPIPQMLVGIPEYTRLPFLGRWFSIKGHVGYGFLTDNEWRKSRANVSYANGILFHAKQAFVQFGDKERYPLLVTLGLEMNSLFGGSRFNGQRTKDYPSDLGAYWTALFPFHHVENQGDEDGDNLGSWHLNFDYYVNDWRIGAYYEHFYEDHSAMLGIEYKNNQQGNKDFIFFGFRRNWFDGLFGLEVNAPDGFPYFKNLVLEFMNTRGQCGPIMHSTCANSDGMYVVEEVDGRDGMYNHGIYDSYSHHGFAIGNPVLISPAYNESRLQRFRSNRARMFHVAVDGDITKSIDYRLLATTTKHWGVYGGPLKEVERITSVMLECGYRFKGEQPWKLSIAGAMDFDSAALLGNNKGVMVTVSKKLCL